MSEFLFQYHDIAPTTWVYLSSLLLIGLFFKFSRFWSVRNLDLILLIMLGPGLLMVHYGQAGQGEFALQAKDMPADVAAEPSQASASPAVSDLAANPSTASQSTPNLSAPSGSAVNSVVIDLDENPVLDPKLVEWQELEVWGFVFLCGVSVLTMTRLLLDPVMVRRPLLEPNLSQGGLMFIGIALFAFLMANLIAEPATARTDVTDYRIARVSEAVAHGPDFALVSVLPAGVSKPVTIVGHLLVVVGLTLVGYWHFRNLVMGVGAAALYLMLPYTSLLTGRIEHILPAAFLVWAILLYRRPVAAGMLLALASLLVYYPLLLLPLWLSFYWHRGLTRFMVGFFVTLAIGLVALLIFSPLDLWSDLAAMFWAGSGGVSDLGGIWNTETGFDANYRIPVLVTLISLSISMALWPAQKNLGTLLSCSAAIMVACQLWHGYGGGTYMAWYLPLFLLTVFRPNLEDRVAVSVLSDSLLPKRNKPKLAA